METKSTEPALPPTTLDDLPAHELLLAMRRFASRTWSIVLPLVWLVAVVLSAQSDSMYLAVPFGGLLPMLFFAGLTFFPRIPIETATAAVSAVLLPFILVYVSDGVDAWAGGWYLGLGLLLLYVRWLPFLLFALTLLLLHFWVADLAGRNIEYVWRLDTSLFSYLVSPLHVLPAVFAAVLLGTMSFFGSRFVVREFVRLPGMRRTLAARQIQEDETRTRLQTTQQQIDQLQRDLKQSRQQYSAEKAAREALDTEAAQLRNRVQELFSQSENQTAEYNRKLQQALTEGIRYRSIIRTDGLLFFLLNESGEILTTNEQAAEVVSGLNLKHITSWWRAEQPLLRQAQAHRNWPAFRLMLSRSPELVQIKTREGKSSWVWMATHMLDALNTDRKPEWMLIAVGIDIQQIADLLPSSTAEDHSRKMIQLRQELDQTQRLTESRDQLLQEVVAQAPAGMALLQSVHPLNLLHVNTRFQHILLNDTGSNWKVSVGQMVEDKFTRVGPNQGFSFPYHEADTATQTTAFYQVNLQPLRPQSAEGSSIWLATVQDQTRIHQAEALFEEVAESSPAPFLIAGMNSRRIIYGNESLRQTLGYTVEELVDLSPDDLFAEPRERAQLIVDLKREGAVQGYGISMLSKSGDVFKALCSLRVSSLLGERCILGSFLLLPEALLKEPERPTSPAHEVIKRRPPAGNWTLSVGPLTIRVDQDLIDLMDWKDISPTTPLKLHEFLNQRVHTSQANLVHERISQLIAGQNKPSGIEFDYILLNDTGGQHQFLVHLEPVVEDEFLTGCRAIHWAMGTIK